MPSGTPETPEHRAWRNIKTRCYDKGTKYYKYYGGRGVRMHTPWRNSLSVFLTAVGPRPSPKHSIDRVDNGRGYVPGNVRWATRSEQMRNTRRCHMLTALGRTASVAQWAEWMKIPYTMLQQRVTKLGWETYRAIGLA